MKDQDHLKHYLVKIINTDNLSTEIDDILACFKLLELKKNAYLVEEGAICKWFCFIESGVLQHAISVLGEEKTTYLGLKNSCTTALKSFTQKAVSRKHIKAISNCKLWVINTADFKNLLQNNKAFQTFYFNLIESQIYLIDDHRIDLLTLSAEERYNKLLDNEPNLLQQVPLRYLASYLGISIRNMSRIRKHIN